MPITNLIERIKSVLKPKQLCYDSVSARYFKTDKDSLIRKIRTFESMEYTTENGYSDIISLNEFYGKIGLPTIEIGDKLGWNLEKHIPEFDIFYSYLSDSHVKKPCLVLFYEVSDLED